MIGQPLSGARRRAAEKSPGLERAAEAAPVPRRAAEERARGLELGGEPGVSPRRVLLNPSRPVEAAALHQRHVEALGGERASHGDAGRPGADHADVERPGGRHPEPGSRRQSAWSPRAVKSALLRTQPLTRNAPPRAVTASPGPGTAAAGNVAAGSAPAGLAVIVRRERRHPQRFQEKSDGDLLACATPASFDPRQSDAPPLRHASQSRPRSRMIAIVGGSAFAVDFLARAHLSHELVVPA